MGQTVTCYSAFEKPIWRLVFGISMLLASCPNSSSACSCSPETRLQRRDGSKIVAFAKAEKASIDPLRGSRTIQLKVIETFKGKMSKRLTVRNEAGPVGCGAEFLPGSNYLLFPDSAAPDSFSICEIERVDKLTPDERSILRSPTEKDREKELEAISEQKKKQSAEQHYLSGVMAFQKGNRDDARKEWKQALAIDPSNSDAKAGLNQLEIQAR
jgi:tetratricopeptide (TPR) repeat protein